MHDRTLNGGFPSKSSKSISEFKTKIKNFGNIDCGCLVCSYANLYFKFTL